MIRCAGLRPGALLKQDSVLNILGDFSKKLKYLAEINFGPYQTSIVELSNSH